MSDSKDTLTLVNTTGMIEKVSRLRHITIHLYCEDCDIEFSCELRYKETLRKVSISCPMCTEDNAYVSHLTMEEQYWK